MQLYRSEEDLKTLEKKVKKIWKDKGDQARGSVLIAQAKMDVEYMIGKCDTGNYQLWNYHYFEKLTSKIT